MNTQNKPLVAVFGSTGKQGGSVVRYLKEHGGFRVRAITRNPANSDVNADEVVFGDLTQPGTLDKAVEGAYAVFLVTNYWATVSVADWSQTPSGQWSDPVDEYGQGVAAVAAAKRAGVEHFIWSTLPDTAKISDGAFAVPFWTGKAKLDPVVSNAGFKYHSFVEAPFYYQNFLQEMAPQIQEDGSKAWGMPMDPDMKVMHMADIDQMGALVLGTLLNPEKVGQGQHLSLASGSYSWSDVMATLNAQGHKAVFNRVPDEVFKQQVPGAKNMLASLNYMEQHTYFGPDAEQKIALAKSVATEPLLSLGQWALKNMPA